MSEVVIAPSKTLAVLPISLPGTWTEVGWFPPEQQMPFEQYEQIVETLIIIGKSNPFHKGDMMRYGERTWGEYYAQAVDVWMLKYGSLANYASVCSRIDISRRREKLSFSHHSEVAYFEPKVQDAILNLAERKNLTVKQTREVKRRVKAALKRPLPPRVQLKFVDDDGDEQEWVEVPGEPGTVVIPPARAANPYAPGDNDGSVDIDYGIHQFECPKCGYQWPELPDDDDENSLPF